MGDNDVFIPHTPFQGLYSLRGRTSYRKVSRSLEPTRFGLNIYNRSDIRQLPSCLPNFRAMLSILHPISQLLDFARFCDKTSIRLVNRCPVLVMTWHHQDIVAMALTNFSRTGTFKLIHNFTWNMISCKGKNCNIWIIHQLVKIQIWIMSLHTAFISMIISIRLTRHVREESEYL